MATINNSVSFRFLLQENTEEIIAVDSSVGELLGYQRSDFIQEKVLLSALIHTDDQDIASELFSLTPQQSLKKTNLRCRKENGKIICLQVNYQKRFVEQSNAFELLLTLEDVRLLKQSQEEQLLTTNFSAMMDNTDDYIYFKDRNHVFTGASQTLVALTNPSETWKDLIGKTDYDVFPENLADDYYRLEKQVFSGKIEVAHEVQKTLDLQDVSGWVDNRKYPIKDSTGTIIGLFGIARDITESKALEQALKESEHRFRTIFNSSPIGIATIDSLNGHIYDANPAYAQIAGRSIEKLRTINWMEITHPDDIQEDLDNMALLNARKITGFNMQKRYLQPDGRYVWVNMTIVPVEVDDKLRPRHLCLTEDITEQKRLNEELKDYQQDLEKRVKERTQQLDRAKIRAESANLAKSRFLSNMSHEIRTPLNAIIGFTHLLKRDDPTAKQREWFNKINASSQHLLQVINNILDISKIEAGKIQLEFSDFHLDAIFEHIQSLFSEEARKKGLQIKIDTNDVPQWINGDRTRLCQALVNYVGNAIKFTESGTITIRLKLLEQRREERFIRFEVEDTGVGIDSEHLSILFNDFEQLDTSISRSYEGTGLGLAITRRLIALMGGESGVESQLGIGSIFWFTVWLKNAQAPQIPLSLLESFVDVETELASYYRGAHILLVEDNIINREVALELLKSVGLKVETAVNGQEAVEKIANIHFDLVLMDVQMPVMDGLEATRLIRGMNEYNNLPILAMTANVFSEDQNACIKAGMNDFIAKPVEPDDVFSTIIKWLPKKQTVVETIANETLSDQPQNDNTYLLEQLESIIGIDIHFGLKNVLNNSETYLRLLQLFNGQHNEDMAKINIYLANNQTESALMAAHSLKGAAGNLGLIQIQNAASELEAQIKNSTDENVTAFMQKINISLKSLSEILDNIEGDNSLEHPVNINQEQLKSILNTLQPLLEKSDTQVNELMQEFGPVLRRIGKKGELLEQQISAFDYHQAQITLNGLLEQF